MEINSHSQLFISPSPLLIKTRKLFLELAVMREVCLIPQSLPQPFLVSKIIFLCICGHVSVYLSQYMSICSCFVVAVVLFQSFVYFVPHCDCIFLSLCLSLIVFQYLSMSVCVSLYLVAAMWWI